MTRSDVSPSPKVHAHEPIVSSLTGVNSTISGAGPSTVEASKSIDGSNHAVQPARIPTMQAETNTPTAIVRLSKHLRRATYGSSRSEVNTLPAS